MIKSLLGKMNKKDEKVSPEILELRKKFAELDAIGKNTPSTGNPTSSSDTPGTAASSLNVAGSQHNQPNAQSENNPNQSATEVPSVQPAVPSQQYVRSQNQEQPGSVPGSSDENVVVNLKHTVPTKKEVKIKLIDAEQAEQDERMTNLIMEQIKELIEIDDNLNTKIKDLSGQLAGLKEELEKTQKENKKAMDRMNIIESNMEKFMALYEVVTNQYNPFVSKESQSNQQQNPSKAPEVGLPLNSPQPSEEPNIGDGIGKTQEESVALSQPTDTSPSRPENTGGAAGGSADKDTESVSGLSSESGSSVNAVSSTGSSPTTQAVRHSVQDQPGSAAMPDGKESPEGRPKPTPPSSSQDNHQETPVIVDKIDQSASLADLIETRINNVLADFKANFRKELHVDIDRKITEMVQSIERSLNRQLSAVVKGHIENELRDKLGKILETESPDSSRGALPSKSAGAPVSTSGESNLQAGGAPAGPAAHQEVHPDNYFWLPDGRPVRNLAELEEELSVMDDSTFSQHVSQGKNDFAEWVRYVIKNEDLARQLEAASSKSEMLQAVRSALEK